MRQPSHVTAAEATPPMVAFMCGKPAMHLGADGWERDDTADCLKNPFDILNYCKKVRSYFAIDMFVKVKMFGKDLSSVEL